MIAVKNPTKTESFVVVHPLFDVPEEKCDPMALGRMEMSRGTRFALVLLRAYLVVMGALLAYHVFDLVQQASHHP